MFQTEHLQEKWQPVLEHPDLPKIEDSYKRAVTTLILENQEKALKEDASFLTETAPVNSMGGGQLDTWDPILISLVRRAMPNLIAYDVCGVQPMTGPTGLIFAMRSSFTSQDGAEALVDEVFPDFSNQNAAGTIGGGDIGSTETNPAVLNDSPSAGTYVSATGMTRSEEQKSLVIAVLTLSLKWRSQSRSQRLPPCPVPSNPSTRWNSRKTLKQFMVLMPRRNSATFCPQKSLLKSTVRLFVLCTSPLLRVLRLIRQLPVSLTLTLTPTVVGRLRSSKV